MRNTTSSYSDRVFYTPAERAVSFAAFIQKHSPDRVQRILDVGSGSGDLAFELANSFPTAVILGNDISEPSIQHATVRASSLEKHLRSRLEFVAGDYLDFKDQSVDLLVSYSVLDLIPVSLEELVKKLASDVAHGGKMILSIPNTCFYNKVLINFRRILQLIRCKPLDNLIYRLARIAMGASVSNEQLKQNIIYMYVVPFNFYGHDFVTCAVANGFVVDHEEVERAESVFKLRHSAVVLSKIKT